MGIVLEIRFPFWVPNIIRHPYKEDPKRDPNLENYPYGLSQPGATIWQTIVGYYRGADWDLYL